MSGKEQQGQWQPPAQRQSSQPGHEEEMHPKPAEHGHGYQGSGKLREKIALITGGDSGIGRAVAILYAREGANIAIVYLNEHEDAQKTKELVEKEGRQCLIISGDV
ncbi:MAG TPA: SDR family NAD(P)-dependent oxidoreductase, partial [Armatimonadota bacterium]|nr:SDR family NAD(P)-dependent oxidoreductase [Armatimonadota bacterium]